MNIRYSFRTVSLLFLFAFASVLLAQPSLDSVSPNTAEPGESSVTVTFTLPNSTPPTPPENVTPSAVSIGSYSGSNIVRVDFTTVTADFDFPVNGSGTYDASVTFSTPSGDTSISLSNGFTVVNSNLDSSAGPPASGYNLFSPLGSSTTTLMDNQQNVIKTWTSSYGPGLSMYLLENGDLIRTASTDSTDFDTGGASGRIERYNWDGDLIWEFDYDSANFRSHHDIEVLPNGNILIVAWQLKTEAEAIQAGRDSAQITEGELWPDSILEIEPTGTSGGNIVWEWHVWDHLIQDHDVTKDNYGVVADHPEKININYMSNTRADWNHINSIDYNPELKQIIVSVRNFSEIWVIDHDSTTAEAAGAAGDLLYRWGNPAAYGGSGDQQLFNQHDAKWIEAGLEGEGNILIFNNGRGREDGDYSSVEEITLPLQADESYDWNMDATLVWNFTASTPTDFYASRISGAQRLRNGNTLICEGTEFYAFEVTKNKELVWEYTDTAELFRVERYAPDFAGFADTELALSTRSYVVVDTAQEKFYNNSSSIDEPAAGDDFYGQDAHHDGPQPMYELSPDDLTVYDYHTRLTWTRSPDWNGDGEITIDDKMTQSEAAAYVATLNAANYGGFNDWRLPSIKEVYSLMDFRGTDPMSDDTTTLLPFINSDYFEFAWGDLDADERTVDSQVATTSLHLDTILSGPQAMSGLNIVDGRIKAYPTSKVFLVYLCRGNPEYAVNDFSDNGDGTVTDDATGLMWMKADSASAMSWEAALEYVKTQNTANYLGYSDWRLPNAKELQSLVDYSRAPGATDSPAIDPVFSCTEITNEGGVKDWPWYFSSTTHAKQDGTGSAAVYVCFGRATGYFPDKWDDVHGSGAQRSDPKSYDTTGYTYNGNGWYYTTSPQGDAARWSNYVRLVRDAPEELSTAPVLLVQGDGVSAISNGDMSPSSEEGTDFGNESLTSNIPGSAPFEISNTGDADLVISAIVISGEHDGDFGLDFSEFTSVIAAGSSTLLSVTFDPSFVGARNAIIELQTNDADSPFTFAVTGTGTLEVIYVHDESPAAPADQNGAGWDSAFEDLQDALAIATAGHEIRVAGGIYHPDEAAAGHASVTDNDRSSTFSIPAGVTLNGSYDSSTGEQKIGDYVSTLSGDLDGDDIVGEGYVDSDPGTNTKNNNAYSVVTALNIPNASPAILNGFRITSGRADGSGSTAEGNGAALYVDASDGLTVSNIIFVGNYSQNDGGALYWLNSGAEISDCSFEQNHAVDSGSAIYTDTSSLTLQDCDFLSNKASEGTLNIQEAGALVERCIFRGNEAEGGGGIYVDELGNATIRNSLLFGNRAILGGGVAAYGEVDLENTTIANNSASGTGGGVSCFQGSTVTLKNSIVTDNLDISGNAAVSTNVNNSLATVSIASSCIGGSGGSSSWQSSIGTDGGGNVDVDPLFSAAGDENATPFTVGDYQLGENSPVVNVGINEVALATQSDLAGRTRVQHERVDMGAYECPDIWVQDADEDEDALGDWSELVTYSTDPQVADSDGDGANDGDEITAGTDPLDIGSVLALSMVMEENGDVTFTWTSQPGRSYILRASDDLSGTGSWQWKGFRAYTDGTESMTISPDAEDTCMFYRLVVYDTPLE